MSEKHTPETSQKIKNKQKITTTKSPLVLAFSFFLFSYKPVLFLLFQLACLYQKQANMSSGSLGEFAIKPK